MKQLTYANMPLPDEEIIAGLTAMTTQLTRQNSDDNAALVSLQIYVGVLSKLPGYAVKQAMERFLDGRAGDGKWMPSAALIGKEAERLAGPLDGEMGKLRAVLAAEVVDEGPAQKTPADELLKPFRDNWNPTVKGQKRDERDFQPKGRVPLTDDQFKENVANLKADWAARDAAAGHPVMASPALLKTLRNPSLTNYGDGKPRPLPGDPEGSQT